MLMTVFQMAKISGTEAPGTPMHKKDVCSEIGLCKEAEVVCWYCV